jgi:hypothetical protein
LPSRKKQRKTAAMPELLSRFLHTRAILKRPIINSAAGLLSLLSVIVLIRDEFMPVEWRETLKMLNLLQPILSIQWYWFAFAALLTLLFGAIEGSYRLFRARIGSVRMRKPIVSNIILHRSFSNTDPLYIFFNVNKKFKEFDVSLQYSAFVNGTQWTFPATVVIYRGTNVARGQRIYLKLITREESKDYLSGIHWGMPTGSGEPYSHIVFGGLFRARIMFTGDTKNETQHYYFFAMAYRTNDDNIRLEIIPDADINFINQWELKI